MIKAEQLIVNRHHELETNFYGHLTELVKKFEERDCWLAATAMYRALLLDILQSARSKAYGHAAKYFKKLEKLSAKINNYSTLDEHVVFLENLEKFHGRKRSFWERVS